MRILGAFDPEKTFWNFSVLEKELQSTQKISSELCRALRYCFSSLWRKASFSLSALVNRKLRERL